MIPNEWTALTLEGFVYPLLNKCIKDGWAVAVRISDVINVQEKIQNQLKEYFDFEKQVLPVSKDSGEELDKILKDIDTEY